MKKKLFLTSILALAATFTFASCDNKKSNDKDSKSTESIVESKSNEIESESIESKEIESTESTESESNSESQSGQESNLDIDYENFNIKNLNTSNLSLRDQAKFLSDYNNLEIKNLKGSIYEIDNYTEDGNDSYSKQDIEVKTYSNDVLVLNKKVDVEGDYSELRPSLPPVAPSLPFEVELAKKGKVQLNPQDYEETFTIAKTNNYTFFESKSNLESDNSRFVNTSFMSFESFIFSNIDFDTFELPSLTSSYTKLYKIDESNYVLSYENTYTEYGYGESYNRTNNSYEDVTVLHKSVNSTKIFFTKVDNNFQFNYIESKDEYYSDYAFDDYYDAYYKLEDVTLLHTSLVKAELNYDSEEYENKTNFINSFKNDIVVKDVYTEKYGISVDNDGKIVSSFPLVDDTNRISVCSYDLLDKDNNSITLDIKNDLSHGEFYTFNLELDVKTLNDKVLNDVKLDDNESIYTTVSNKKMFNLDLSNLVEIENKDFIEYELNDTTYLQIKNFSSYSLFFTVSAKYENNEITYEISNIDLIEDYSAYIYR